MNSKYVNLPTIGIVTNFDLNKYVELYASDTGFNFITSLNEWGNIDGNHEIYNKYYEIFKIYTRELRPWDCRDINKCKSNFLSLSKDFTSYINDRYEYCKMFNQSIKLKYVSDVFYIISITTLNLVVPVSFNCITYKLLNDYSSMGTSELKAIKGDSIINEQSLIKSDVSKNDLKLTENKLDDEKTKLHQNIKDIEDCKVDELAKLQEEINQKQAELQRRQQSMLDELERTKSKFAEIKQQLEHQMFMLDTEIYAIRCYTGEVVNFVQLRKGKSCAETEPLVMLQKLRYLDEEMSKIVSFYNIDFGNEKYFEKLIANRDDVFNCFCPANKCVGLVRLKHDNVGYFQNEEYGNILQEYEIDHANEIGILIRNGENLWVCWTDDDKIDIKDDMFYVPGVSTYTEDEADYHKDEQSSKNEIASRYFIFSILLSAMSKIDDREPIFTIPEGYNIYSPNDYVIYSTSDGWIEDNRFGTLSDIIDRVNANVKVGDNIITVQHIWPEKYNKWGNGAWENVRGRGDRNITRDASISDKTIYKINCIDYVDSVLSYAVGTTHKETRYNITTNEDIDIDVADDFRLYFTNNDTKETMMQKVKDICIRRNYEFDESKVEFNLKPSYYVSVVKQYSDSQYVYSGGRYTPRKREARVNFQLDKDEYINVELLNSEWIKYIICTKKIGSQYIGGKKINFNYLIPYLNKMLAFVKDREAKEAKDLSQYIDLSKYQNWVVDLSEWKIETNHHILTPRYVQQFAKHLKSKYENEEN